MTSFRVLLAVFFLISVTQVHGVQDYKEAIRSAFYRVFNMDPPRVSGPGPDRGVVKSCGPADANFTVEWVPKIINPEGTIKVFYNYTIPHDFNGGTADVSLKFNKIPNPIFEDSFPIGCDKLRKYIPCPLKGGLKLQGTYPYSNLLMLKGYDGTYEGHIELKNQKGQVMFCADVKFTIKGRG